MAGGESWSNWFSRLAVETEKGLKVLNTVVGRIELAFDANRQRGAGILWLPNSKQALHYYIVWRNSGFDFRQKSDFEIQIANVILGFAMWEGIIHCHRSVMVRQPVVKVCHPHFTLNESDEHLHGDRNDDKQLLWSIVKNCMEGVNGYYEFIGPEKERTDVHFQQVRRLSQGQRLLLDSEAFSRFSLVQSNPTFTLGLILPVFPLTYKDAITAH